MRRLNCTFLFVLAVLFHGLFTVNVYAADEKPVETQTDVQQDNWEFILEIYFWMAEIDATTAGGQDLEFDFDTIMENLDLTLMAAIGTRKDKWNFLIDVLYLDISESSDSNINPVLQLTDRGLEGWGVNPVVAYEIMGGEKGSLQLLAGARYLGIDVDLEFETLPPLGPKKIKDSGSVDVWDGIVGVRGYLNLKGRWFVPYRLDIGTGDSDFTWHAFTGIGYQFDTFKLLAVYRHMDWDFDDDAVLDDLQVSGLVVGAIFAF
ncbi:MAG: hypothetical protein JRK53_28660 [Deltaproteobacteria bacterium]|nr:hypothetical protein [Deltaproteobacteria bacterium]MBW1820073.1 hypothetical protein [Deltaproteobacteria bacterium]